MRSILIAVAAIFLSFHSAIHAGEFAFKSITGTSGIPMYGITSLAHDDDGFVWAASRMGIMRATPTSCRLYDLPFSASNVMQVKLAYSDGNLVAVTQNGQIFRYDRIHDRFDRWFSLSQFLGQRHWVTNVAFDSDGKVWISTSTGIFVHSGSKLTRLETTDPGYSHVTPAVPGRMFAISGNSLYSIDTSSLKAHRLSRDFSMHVASTCYDPYAGRLLLGTYKGELWQFSPTRGRLEKACGVALPRLIIRSIIVPGPDSIYIGVEGGGIMALDSGGERILNVLKEDLDNPSAIKGNSVYSLLLDSRKRLWTATTGGGLQYAETAGAAVEHLVHKINNPQSLHNNDVNHIISDPSGNLWIATNDGISRRDSHTGEWHQYYGGRQLVVLSLAIDRQGRIYAATYGDGVYVLDAATGQPLRHLSESDAGLFGYGRFVFAAMTDSDNDIWFGGVKGNIVCLDTSEGNIREYGDYPVFSLAEARPGKILACGGEGMVMIDKRSGKTETLLADVVLNDVTLRKDTAWACTSGNGVVGIDLSTRKEIHITSREGLHSNHTRGAVATGDDLWISTAKGICCYNFASGSMRLLPAIELLAKGVFSSNSALRTTDGKLAFGSNNGVILFNPDSLTDLKTSGRLFFSDIRVLGKSIREYDDYELEAPVDSLEELRLEYPHNSFTLSLLPLGEVSSNPGFSWKLEGADKDWSEISPMSYINYINLKPGKYTLHVRLHDGGILAQRRLGITVTGPFWQSPWFRIIMVLGIMALAAAAVRQYVLRMQRRYAYEKIRFFTRMAHDIRTALMLIKAPIDELRGEEKISKWGRQCLDLASEQASRLSCTATQLLDFEKIDTGLEQPNFVRTDIVALFRRRIDVYGSFASTRHIQISAHFTPPEYTTEVDERMMERIIDNMLSNAVKYSHPESGIEIVFCANDSQWSLRVTDHGIGIGKSELKKLFKEFYRAENAVNSSIIGSGIGLVTIKRYTAIHKGSITVDSEPGKGTTFEVTVPLRLTQQAADASKERCADSAPSAPQHDSKPVADDGTLKDMHILIVEDNPALCGFMASALNASFRVSTAENGDKALAMMAGLQPDLVLSDIIMPGIDGFELCRRIKSDYATSHIPVILLTSLSDNASQIHGLGLGADNYLVKPFDMALLASRIKSIILNRRTVLKKALEFSPHKDGGNDGDAIVSNRINDEFLKKAIECVRDNMANEDFGKGEFASALAMSQSLLYKKIKALTNLSVVEFIRSIRLKYALELLRTKEYNVTEVSEMCGFSTPAYFSRVFKDHFGAAPSEIMTRGEETAGESALRSAKNVTSSLQ